MFVASFYKRFSWDKGEIPMELTVKSSITSCHPFLLFRLIYLFFSLKVFLTTVLF